MTIYPAFLIVAYLQTLKLSINTLVFKKMSFDILLPGNLIKSQSENLLPHHHVCFSQWFVPPKVGDKSLRHLLLFSVLLN